LPRKTFSDGDSLPASDLNTYLMDQSVQTYSSATDRTADLPTPADGQVTTLNTTKNLETYYGQWRPLPFAVQSFLVSVVGTGTSTATTAITFEAGRFTEAPIVLATSNNSSIQSTYITSPTTSGCNVVVRRFDNANFSSAVTILSGVMAVQMTNGTAAG
jgi:hypothetical protein